MTGITIPEGVARVSVLRARGHSNGRLRSAVERGELIRIRKGWLGMPDAQAEVVRAISLGGRLACLSATRQLGLWTPQGEQLHIARPRHAGRTHGDPTGVIEHWQSSAWREHESPIEEINDAIRQIILCCSRETAIIVIDSALNRGMTTRPDLGRVLDSLPAGHREILALVDARSESGLETICRLRLTSLGLRVRTQVRVAEVGRVDLIIGDRLVIEADGREWHEGSVAFETDRARDLTLLRKGYVVIRLSYTQIMTEWALVEASIRALIELGEHRWRPGHYRAGLAG